MNVTNQNIHKAKTAKFHTKLRGKFRSMAGLSLIEILVTVVVLSIGLLGIAGMQAFGMRYSHDSYARSQATMFANELIERMHANTDGVANGDYADAEVNAALNCSAVTNDPAHPTNAAPDCAGASTCSVTELAQLDFFRTRCGQFINGSGLVGGVENLLPGGSVAIECTDTSPGVAPACEGDDTRTVTITWQDPNQKDDPLAPPLQVQVNSRIL